VNRNRLAARATFLAPVLLGIVTLCGHSLRAQTTLPHSLGPAQRAALFAAPAGLLGKLLPAGKPATSSYVFDEVKPLEEYAGDIDFAKTVRTLLGEQNGTERARASLVGRAKEILQALEIAKRAYNARTALTTVSSSDDSLTKAVFAFVASLAVVYDSTADLIPPEPLHMLTPVSSVPQARCFWGRPGAKALTNADLAFSGSRSAVAVELYQDYFLVGIRGSVGTSLSATTSQDSTQANIQRFMSAGGNASLGFAWPVLAISNRPLTCDPSIPQLHGVNGSFQVILWPRFGFDVPKIGATTTTGSMNADLGVDFRLAVSGADQAISAFADIRPAAVLGNRTFYQGIGYSPAQAFVYCQITVGLALGGQYSFTFTWAYAPASLQSKMQGVGGLSLSH